MTRKAYEITYTSKKSPTGRKGIYSVIQFHTNETEAKETAGRMLSRYEYDVVVWKAEPRPDVDEAIKAGKM